MAALHPILNSISQPNGAYIDQLYDDGRKLIERATNEVSRMSAALPKLDFTGINPSLTDPTGGGIGVMPIAPSKPLLMDTPIDAFPLIPVLTTDTIASDVILLELVGQIKSHIEYRLSNATGLSAAVEAALFGRAVDRETALMRTGFGNYLANQAALGWSSPAGQDQAAFISFEKERKAKLSDINRDIMVKQAELEQSNSQRNLELFQSFQAQLFSQKQSDEANKLRAFEIKMDAVIKKAQLYININKGWIDIYANEVQAYTAQSRATMDEARFRMEQVAAVNELNTQMSMIAMEKLKLLAQDNVQRAGMANEASKAIAAVLGQLSATLMNSINISQTFGTSKSWDYSETLSA